MSKKREDSDHEKPLDAGRRRLLGMALYVPPIVIGAISLSQAGCQPDPPGCSCAPNGFKPCPPVPSKPAPPSKHEMGKLDSTPEG